MCGIAGIVSFGPPVDGDLLRAMNARLVHRGPDDGGEWVDATSRVGLANRRLAILDLSAAGHQPMVARDSGHVIAYNGEIYNFLELRHELEGHGHRFCTGSDTEVLLAAYAHWGDACVERLNGMFAFAIWDPGRQRLFAARDRFGEKPFYYHRSPERLVFASEIKALLADSRTPRAADEAAVTRYLLLAQLDGDERTFFDSICQLRPAHTLSVDRDGTLTTRRYWQLDLAATLDPGEEPDAPERFRELLFDSIRLRMRSDVPVGSSLSGGLDSSSIVCAMSRLVDRRAQQQNTFSARYRSGGTDEGRYIREVTGATAVQGHEVFIEGADLAGEVERFLWFQDEPVAHTSQYAQWKVMQLARDTGVTVLLDGQGADEIIGGYPAQTFGYGYAELLRGGRIGELARELGAYRRHQGSFGPALRYLAAALLPEETRSRQRTRAHATRGLRPRWTADSLAGETAPGYAAAPVLRQALYRTLTSSSLPGLLRYGDRNSMAFSREARLPFLDHRLVEFAYALPSRLLLRDAVTKTILRQAMDGIIPEPVRVRMDKVGFATPERDWFLGPMQPWLRDALDGLKRRDVVPGAAIGEQWQRFLRGGDSGTVWRLANLEAWMRRFIDRVPEAA